MTGDELKKYLDMEWGNDLRMDPIRDFIIERQDDIAALRSALEILTAENGIMRRSLEFYGDPKNWENVTINVGVGHIGVPETSYAASDHGSNAQLALNHRVTKEEITITMKSLFEIGNVVKTRGADALGLTDDDMRTYLARHVSGDHGDLDDEDREHNKLAIKNGWQILSVYRLNGKRFYIITDGDRRTTTFLVPNEY